MPVHLVVDTDICIGSGECVGFDPEAVEIDQGMRPRARRPDGRGARRELCDTCPVGALSIAS